MNPAPTVAAVRREIFILRQQLQEAWMEEKFDFEKIASIQADLRQWLQKLKRLQGNAE